jgi:hypothetical protein
MCRLVLKGPVSTGPVNHNQLPEKKVFHLLII